MSTGALAVVSDREGTLFVDGERKTAVVPDKVVSLNLTAGQHFVDLRDGKGAKLWEKIVTIPAGTQVAERILLNGDVKSAQSQSVSDTTNPKNRRAFLCALERYKEAIALGPGACGLGPYTNRVDVDALASKVEEEKSHYCTTSTAHSMMTKAKDDASRLQIANDCVFASKFAHDLYFVGRNDEALSYANDAIDDSSRQVSFEDYIAQSNSRPSDSRVITYQSAIDDYALRARVKHALSDENGALKDLDSASELLKTGFELYTKYINATNRQEFFGGPFSMKFALERSSAELHIYRSIVFATMGRYSDAIAEINEPTPKMQNASPNDPTFGDSEMEKIATTVRNGIRSEMGSSIASSFSPSSTSPRPTLTQEIAEAERSGHTLPLPASTPCLRDANLAGTMARYEVKNSTAYELRVILSGPAEQEIRIVPNLSQTVTLPAGSYKVLGRVSAPNVLPFLGQEVFSGGQGCSSEFYIEPKP